jgi:serine/threonine protein kinase
MVDPKENLPQSGAPADSSVRLSSEEIFRDTAHYQLKTDEVLPRGFGRYELRALLGRGGMGAVYQAYDPELDRLVALKIPKSLGDEIDDWRERFKAEARAAATILHPNICPVYEVGEINGQPYLTMPLIEGETLASRLRRLGKMPIEEALSLVSVVARSMSEAHQRGIVHRDLKPANIMIDRRGQPIIMDFGLAYRTVGAADLKMTLSGVALGTPEYMPPEQAGGDHEAIGPSSDVYSLGVILFELVTGQLPFIAKSFGMLVAQIVRDMPPSPSRLNPGVSDGLEAVILKALEKEPSDRFASAAALANALDSVQRGEPLGEWSKIRKAAAPVTLAGKPVEKRRRWTLVGAIGGVGLVVLAAFALLRGTGLIGGRSDGIGESSGGYTFKGTQNTSEEETVAAPKNATPIELAGRSILVDASKSEMQAWLDDQKKRNRSVTWLDVTSAKDAPVYAAVASHDQSEADWLAFLDVSQTEINDVNEIGKRGIASKHMMRSLGGHVTGAELECATLFHLEKRPIARLGKVGVVGLDSLVNQIPDLQKQGFYAKILRPIKVGGKVRYFGGYFEMSPHLEQHFGIDLSREKLQAEIKSLRAKGYRPYCIAPGRVGGELRFSYTSCDEPTDDEWEHFLDLTSFDVNLKANEMAAKGFALDSIIGYPWDGAIRYSTVWLKAPHSASQVQAPVAPVKRQEPIAAPKQATRVETAGWSFLLDATREEVEVWLEEQRKSGGIVEWFDAVELEERPLFSGFASKGKPKKEWFLLMDLSVPEIDSPAIMNEKFGLTTVHMRSVAGYEEAGKRKALVLAHAGDIQNSFLGLPTPQVLQNAINTVIKDGYAAITIRPLVLKGVVTNLGIFFAASSADQLAMKLNATREQLDEELESHRAKGIRPNFVTPYASGGALQYSCGFSDAKEPFEYHEGWTAAEFETRANEVFAKGLRPETVFAYPWDGAVRYGSIWVKDAAAD